MKFFKSGRGRIWAGVIVAVLVTVASGLIINSHHVRPGKAAATLPPSTLDMAFLAALKSYHNPYFVYQTPFDLSGNDKYGDSFDEIFIAQGHNVCSSYDDHGSQADPSSQVATELGIVDAWNIGFFVWQAVQTYCPKYSSLVSSFAPSPAPRAPASVSAPSSSAGPEDVIGLTGAGSSHHPASEPSPGCVGASACEYDNGINFSQLYESIATAVATKLGSKPNVNCDIPNRNPPNTIPVGKQLTCLFEPGPSNVVVAVDVLANGGWTWQIVASTGD